MSAHPKHRYTLEEYLELERTSEIKYEYWNGEIFSMSGGTLNHDHLMGNLFDLFKAHLRGKPCQVFTNNMQIKVPAAPPYRYADGSVVCGQVEVERFNGNDLLVNPVLIVEVLSPSTEGHDRGQKFTWYKSIPTFKEYLLIVQDKPHLIQYVKQAENKWLQSEFLTLNDRVYLPSLDGTLALSEVYQGVTFPDTVYET